MRMIERKCLYCGTWNNNEKYCKNCNQAIHPDEINRLKEKEKRIAEKNKPKSKFEIFVEACKNHRFLLVRILYKIGYSIGVVFAAIGGLFAWLIAMANG
jgi:uncharacterized membrane protein YvbJ